MSGIIKKNFHDPEKVETPEKLRSESVDINGNKFQRVTVEPGWQWSKHLKPVVGGDSCQLDHLLYVLSGKLTVKMNDGEEKKLVPGDLVNIPPGHDGWNSDTEPVVWLELPH